MQKKRPNLKVLTVVFACIVLGYIVVLNIFSNDLFRRIDLTQQSIYSISEISKNRLKQLDDLVTLELYFSDNLPPNLQKMQGDVKDIVDEFRIYAGNNLRVVWRDPVKQSLAKDDANSLKIPPVQVQSIEKDKMQLIEGYMGLAIRYGGKSEIIPLVQNTSNFEYEILQRIIRLTSAQLPIIGIVKTDTMPNVDSAMAEMWSIQPREDITRAKYAPLFNALKDGYELRYIDLKTVENIDPAITTLIVPGENQGDYFSDPASIYAIDQYLMRGGNVIVLAQRFALDLKQSANATLSNSYLQAMLSTWGVAVQPQMLIDASCGQIMVPRNVGSMTMNVPTEYPYLVRITEDGFNRDITPLASLSELILPWASPLEVTMPESSHVTIDTLVRSSDYATGRVPPFRLDPNQDWKMLFERALNAGTLKSYPLAVRVSGNIKSVFADTTLPLPENVQRDDIILSVDKGSLIVMGNADFMSTDGGGVANTPFIQNIVDWLTLDENLIGIRSRTLVDRTMQQENMAEDTESHAMMYRIINLVTMPLLLSLVGLGIFLRRKRQQKTGV